MATRYDPEATAEELLELMPLLNRIMSEEVRRTTGPDTTMPQFRVLGLLIDGPVSLSELARQRRVSLQSMGELAQVLVDRGWAARRVNPDDRRQQLLELTQEGRRHHGRAQQNMVQRFTPILARFGPPEGEAVRAAIASLRRAILESEQAAALPDHAPMEARPA